ncbi:MAG TPA: FecR family protein [Chitinophaga sp.]|uniref:FecR family protein n=1 Tax=Chitinophaga sp. TaxID=1869181 RepID=UPI002B8D4E09|nr:FecR family protein [Chitinophaga sp.]HVI48535.1 FecR family protein [Chitinophaga sp.]
MQELQQAIENYLAGKASPKERQLVNDWYYSFDDSSVEIPEATAALRRQVRQRIYDRLQETVNNDNSNGKSRRYFPLYRQIAATLLCCLLGAGFLFLIHNSRRLPHTGMANISGNNRGKILPGRNQAVLILANGDSILLDSARNGTISKQGSIAVVKLNNGILAYNKKMADSGDHSVSFNTISTPRGGQYQVFLPDGTIVWLNAASSLKFPIAFSGSSREVTLEGEGYFEVKPIRDIKKRKIPFIVSVNTMQHNKALKVTVLGTKFNIMAYKDEEYVKTTLLEGAVAASNSEDSMLLQPGEQAAMPHTISTKFRRTKPDIQEVIAWKNGEFRFTNAGIRYIMRQMARWYDVDVEYRGNIDLLRLSGQVPRKEDISLLLDAFETTGKVHFTIEGRKIIVQPS